MIGEKLKITIMQQINDNLSLAAQKTLNKKTIFVKGVHEVGSEFTVIVEEELEESIITRKNSFTKQTIQADEEEDEDYDDADSPYEQDE